MSPADVWPGTPPDLRRVNTWIFDLDNTLYPSACELLALCDERMTDFVARETGLSREESRRLQHLYHDEHGTTLAGLMAHHGVDPHAFLDEVHDIPLDRLTADPALDAALARLPGRRLVFTNGSEKHAANVLDALGIAARFEEVFALDTMEGFIPKPSPAAFANLVGRHAVRPASAAFFEDMERNLEPAAALGMTTVLVGSKAASSGANFVHHRAPELTAFLNGARLGS